MFKKFLLLAALLLQMAPWLWAAPAESSPSLFRRGGLFRRAVIVTAKEPGKIDQKAAHVLQEEIQKRTGIELKLANQWPDGGVPVIAVGIRSQAGEFAGPFAAEMEAAVSPGAEGFSVAL